MRLFVAIDLSEAIRESLSDQIHNLRKSFDDTGVKWVKASAIHLTLKFLGETPDNKLDEIKCTLSELSPQFPTFTFTIGTIGCFPSSKRPRVIWIGIKDSTGILKEIHHQIEMEFRKIRFKPENRPFKAHLTLGRVKKNLSSAELISLAKQIDEARIGELGTETVRDIRLIRSVLRPTGAEYTSLGVYPLAEKE